MGLVLFLRRAGLVCLVWGRAEARPYWWLRFGLEEAAGGVYWTVSGDAVVAADEVVVHAVAGSGVNGAGAGFERDVFAEEPNGVALDERVAEDGFIELGAFEFGEYFGIVSPT